MLKKIKISVIIPTYNQKEDYLYCAVESAINQICKPHEIIIVNDGGKEIPYSFTYCKDNNIKIINKEKNGGTASALNLGIEHMSGDYFSWLSSDDFMYPHFLAAHESVLSHEMCTAKISYSGFSSITVDDNDVVKSVIDYKPPIENKIQVPFILDEKEFFEILKRNLFAESCQFNGCCFVINKAIFDDIGKFETANLFTQDMDMWIRIAKKYRLAVIPQILLARREHNNRTQFMFEHDAFLEQRTKEMRTMQNKYLFNG